MYRVSVLVGQLCERYYRTPKDGGRAIVYPADWRRSRVLSASASWNWRRLHVLAAAAQVIIDEAHRAFGLTPPSRHFPASVATSTTWPTRECTSRKRRVRRSAPLVKVRGLSRQHPIPPPTRNRNTQEGTIMAYISPSITASGTTFAQFQSGGASRHMENLIAANLNGARLLRPPQPSRSRAPGVCSPRARTTSGSLRPTASARPRQAPSRPSSA